MGCGGSTEAPKKSAQVGAESSTASSESSASSSAASSKQSEKEDDRKEWVRDPDPGKTPKPRPPKKPVEQPEPILKFERRKRKVMEVDPSNPYATQLQAGMQKLVNKLERLEDSMEKNEQIKVRIRRNMEKAQEEHSRIGDRMVKNLEAKKEYQKTIATVREGYGVIERRTQDLLFHLKRTAMELGVDLKDEEEEPEVIEKPDRFEIDPDEIKKILNGIRA